MLHKELIDKAEQTLRLEQCPEPVEVMSPESVALGWPLLAMVFGNLLVGAVLIGGLLLSPYLLALLMGLI